MNPKSSRSRAIRATVLTLVLSLSGAGLYGCQEKKGPLEKAGEKIDEGARDAKRAVEDAVD
jgi:hypothetical protein